jgi:hypothetical protein
MEQVKGVKTLNNTLRGIGIVFGLGAVCLAGYALYLYSLQNVEIDEEETVKEND